MWPEEPTGYILTFSLSEACGPTPHHLLLVYSLSPLLHHGSPIDRGGPLVGHTLPALSMLRASSSTGACNDTNRALRISTGCNGSWCFWTGPKAGVSREDVWHRSVPPPGAKCSSDQRHWDVAWSYLASYVVSGNVLASESRYFISFSNSSVLFFWQTIWCLPLQQLQYGS